MKNYLKFKTCLDLINIGKIYQHFYFQIIRHSSIGMVLNHILSQLFTSFVTYLYISSMPCCFLTISFHSRILRTAGIKLQQKQ